ADAGSAARLRVRAQAGLFHPPLDAPADAALRRGFDDLSAGATIVQTPLDINDRSVEVIARTDDVLWCTYAELCEKPRSA
ncbi:AFG1/ZapE family ATPase, partial [Acinetobacter baumannii]